MPVILLNKISSNSPPTEMVCMLSLGFFSVINLLSVIIIWNFPHHFQFKSSLLTTQRNGLQNAFFIRKRPFSKNHEYIQKNQMPTWADNPASSVTIFAVCLAVSLFFRGWNFLSHSCRVVPTLIGHRRHSVNPSEQKNLQILIVCCRQENFTSFICYLHVYPKRTCHITFSS